MAPKPKTKAQVKKSLMKKPAAKRTPVLEIPLTTTEPFDLRSFGLMLLTESDKYMKAHDLPTWCGKDCLQWCSCFDGLNATAYIFRHMGVNHKQLFGAEIAKGPCVLNLVNFEPEHLFDNAKSTGLEVATGLCVKHGRKCQASGSPDVWVGGFSCKSNSNLRTDRFETDPLAEGSDSLGTFKLAVASVSRHKPVYFIMENVEGVRMRRVTRKDDPTEAAASASKAEDASFSTPLEFYLAYLAEHLVGYNFAELSATSSPLPEKRSRVWILGSRSEQFSASSWARVVSHLEGLCSEKAHHHFDFLTKIDSGLIRSAKGKKPQTSKWAADSAYHMHFSQCVQKAVESGRLPEDVVLAQPDDRESRKALVPDLTPWQAANIDVFKMICDRTSAASAEAPKSMYADVSQAANRGQVVVHGVLKTLASSTRLYDFKKHKLVPPQRYLAALGYGPDLQTGMLTVAETYEMAGNAMSLAGLAKILAPLLVHVMSPSG